ncbi:tail fiber protein [Pseudomonas phage Psa21]|uniref:Tail fiber protein n=1 Tax=Pseudomonas phage Psa21 TaxID=2530023 RepID=A0A481W507_9CAUD|nr:tail fiber protein [Pseudomonas phage Psa21]QBJ02772.1 tail fiber protein [Pseudomonas phage Psa21]
MASNKTKLAAANSKSAFDFDDDFDSMFDDEALGGSKKSPVQQFMAGFKDGIIDPGKNKSLLKAFLTNGAPKGYDRLFGVYDQAKNGVSSLKDHLEKTNPGDLQYLFKRAESFLPAMKGKVSDSTYDRINSALSNKAEQYKYQIEANQDQSRLAIRRQKTQDEETIKQGLGEDLRSAVDQGTVVQRNLFNMGQEADQRRWDLERIERGLRDQVDNKHHQTVARGLAQAVDSLTRMASYTEQVDYDFKRKGLELQFRSYQALRDMSKLAEASLEMQNKAFQALVRNTGLPDHLKSSMKDLMSMNMRQGMAQAGTSMVGRTLSGFLGNYGGNVQNRVNGKASSALSGIVQGMQAGESMGDMWNQRYQLAGNLAADGVHGFARNTLAPIAGRMIRPAMTRMSNKHGRGKHNQAGYMADNIPAFMQEFVNNYQNSHGAKGVLQDILRPFTPQFGLDTATKAGNYQTIGQHTAFNQLSQRSLTEILPGFQARILRELRMLRTGRSDVPMEVFDITKGVFANSKDALSNAQDRIVSKGTTRMVSGQINETLDKIDKDGKLSENARKTLSERLLRDASSNKRFDPMKYGTKHGYREGTDKETLKELEDFFKGQFERDSKGKFADTASNHAKRKEFSDSFLDIRNVSRDPAQEIHRLIEAGKTDQLREMGILITVEGQDRINYPKLWEMMSADVSSKHGGPGKKYHDASGDTGDRNFVGPHFPGSGSARAQNAVINFVDGPGGKRIKDGAKRLGSGAKDLMDQFKTDPMQFMRDQYEQGSTAVKGKAQNLRDSASAAADAAKAGGLPAVLEHFSAKEKLDFAKALLNNVIDKEPPAMREARLQMAQAIINSIESGKEQGAKLLGSEAGQAAIGAGNNVLALGHDKVDQIRKSEAAGIVDLKLQGTQETLIKAVDMAQGKLIDVNTNKIITKASDITGEVRNYLGQQVASAEEVAQGLYSERGQLMAQAKSKLDAVQAVIAKHAAAGKAAAKEKLDDFKDWCLEGSDEVIIKARDLANGAYIDEESGKPVYSLDDIKGTITDHYGKVVATAQELARGLRSTEGTKFDMAGVKDRASKYAQQIWRGNTTQNVFAGMKMAGKVAWALARNTAARMMGDRDAYLPGQVKPVLTVEKLKEGGYLDKDQKPIKSFSDIDGPVFDAETGEPLLDKSELKDLVESNGKKHKIAKNRGLMRRAFKATVGKAAAGYWNLTKKYYGALGRELGNDAMAGAKTILAPMGTFTKRQLANLSTTDQVLVQIRDAIRETVPKKNRKGSWMEREEKKTADELKKDAKDEKEQKESKGLFSKMSVALGGLWDKMRGKKKGEEEEEEGDGGGIMDTVSEAVGTASDAKDLLGGGGNDRGPSRRGGRMARWGKKLAGSRAGQLVGSVVGRVGATAGGQMIARGAMMVGTALAGLVSAPVLIGAAVVAGVAVAGYFTYKYFAGVRGEFMSIRMLQYGITSTRQRHKILELEQLLEKTAVRGPNPQLNVSAAGGKAILDIMGFDATDEASIHRFARWMDLRFKPVFCTWLKALDAVGKTQMSLTEIEEKLDEPLKGTFVKEISVPYGDGSPFAMRDNPFGDTDPLDDTQEEVKAAIEELSKKYKIDPDKAKAALPGVKAAPTEEAKNNIEPTAVVGATAAAAAKKAVDDAKAIGKEANEGKEEAAKSVQQKVNAMAKAAGVGAVGAAAVNSVMPVAITSQELNALDSIRARAYGMESLNKNQMESLIAMETRLDLQSKKDQGGNVKFNGDVEKFISAAGGLFGMNTADHGAERVKFVNWFTERFIPVAETFLTVARQTYQGKPSDAGTAMKLGDQVRVANAVMGAVSPNGNSVWSSPTIFEVKGSLPDLKKLADADMAHLQKLSDAVIASPTQSAGAQAAGAAAAASGKSFMDGVIDKVSDAFNSATDAVSGAASKAGAALGSAASYVSNAASKVGHEIASAGVVAYGAASKAVTGQSYGYVSDGNGGSWEQVPMPTSKDAKGSRKTLEVVSQMTGVPIEYLMVFCALESNFDWTVKAGAGGSATGWFQFINSTWDWVIGQHSAKYGLPADVGRRLRLDPRVNGLMGGEYIKYSMNVIKKGTGKDPTDIDLYLAHFLGPGTAVKWIKMPKTTIGSTAFPKEARANPSVFTDKRTGAQRTLGQIEQSFDERMAKYRSIASAGTSTGAPVPLTTEEMEKKQAADKAKQSETEAKQDDKFIPGVSAMPGGPAVTGSTPTNTGSGGPATSLAASAAAQSPTGGSESATDVTAESAGQTAAATPDSSASNAASGAQAASAAKDAQRAKEVQQSTQNDSAIMSIQQQQLDTQKAMLEALNAILAGQAAPAQGNSMPKQQSRAANKTAYPVTV